MTKGLKKCNCVFHRRNLSIKKRGKPLLIDGLVLLRLKKYLIFKASIKYKSHSGKKHYNKKYYDKKQLG